MLSREQKINRMFAHGRLNAKSVVKTVFGGTDDSSQKAQTRANKKTQAFIEQQGAIARQDVINIAPAAEQNRNLGFQAALDLLGQGGLQQIGAFQQGNVGAQGTLLAGLPQIQNALLGAPVTFAGLQPQTIDIDTSFLQQQLPAFTGIGEALAGGVPGVPVPNPQGRVG